MYHIRFLSSIHELNQPSWDRLLGCDYPFLCFAFLAALEDSGAVGPGTGWQPRYLVAFDEGKPVAALPLYLKQHSFGEYVFDQGWAQAYQRHGLPYYPKWVSAVPFTPVAGPRLLLAEGLAPGPICQAMLDALIRKNSVVGASSWHLLFAKLEALQPWLAQGRVLPLRRGVQYHWFNQGYGGFDDFLASLKARKRKMIAKERAVVAATGVELQVVEGPEITEELWRRFFLFYQNTYAKRSGHGGYLPLAFFLEVGQAMAEQLLLVGAWLGGELVAASLFFKDGECLYGRYWGALADFDKLHFECCYYQGIDYSIRQGLKRFDAGAQGEHKLLRGFEPVDTWSLHWLAEPAFVEAVQRFVAEESLMLEDYCRDARTLLPYKSPQGGA
ncbi:GNAT family N-acetyltransferase [Gallaecimonas kandeliae]|uniref:GNAT family N-acetyltransferase n=1 Tax=Gallaecimonas kandeliae TaxID=3029055 RepID=UPI0026480EEB|nr:GNAT family N-acetyltransferase [Gallaecimonas kandeliae]WKE64147.1 GNAT family N-acetyltransferase [Gallaecimonas kandeliae]